MKKEKRFGYWDGYRFMRGYYISGGEKWNWITAIQYHLGNLKSYLGYSICKWRGHKWVDRSYGGPENGYEAGHCSRCGESYNIKMY